MTRFITWRSLLALLLILPLGVACANPNLDTREHVVKVVPLTDGLENPWSLAFLPNGDMLITERPGRLRIFRDGQLLPDPVAGLPEIRAFRQGGLLDIALHPDFENNRLLYLSYAANHQGGITTRVARGRFENDTLHDVEVLFTAEPASDNGRHFGSRLLFDRAGYLYITVGDRGDMPRAQDLNDHAGSTIRLHDDGRIPEDNPFVGRSDARPEIYTYGNRNAQGMALHPDTGAVWQNEHGPRGGDELNLIRAGVNYGWPVITHGVEYSGATIGEGLTEKEGMEQPVHHWTPSIAPSGMAFYTGDVFPNWRGNVFVGALAHTHVTRLVMDGDRVVEEEPMFREMGQRIRDVRQGPDGYLYLLTDHTNGRLLRVEPAE
ncbi:PQQ-dependent sugar dehydrogenase [Thioalkalivibrio sulfidiphilus]|uniref:Glucose sorbosone dehydrogenase n=1 Tax=Thioalkalivibrio sulfidiphilus (strain HL-EbGR7) TaxID=396588 RepID=B8GQK1_THISH|nr:PQQ-dependent sugar dehydrogenase [Thioalkalivibrio sulfidiphilus]ACL74225.1 glucose sorbosone dehydrogenase [Thioalkalivibrio sulfidiphilus HL-EbGr7]